MIDLMTALLIAFIILLSIQIVALIRIRYIINRLRGILDVVTPIIQKTQYVQRSKQINMRVCQFCKNRQTYIKTTASGEEDFYYRCKLNDRKIDLTDSCKRFELEQDF
ncbi:MAG: hypothetical protein GXO77_11295 [Calditrichaeota bacterium]|nr:hypothetical protein [Calditrichota bacterium]